MLLRGRRVAGGRPPDGPRRHARAYHRALLPGHGRGPNEKMIREGGFSKLFFSFRLVFLLFFAIFRDTSPALQK